MKRTFQPNNRKMKKKHGFFSRIKGNGLNLIFFGSRIRNKKFRR